MSGWLAQRGCRLSPAKCFGFAGFMLALSMGLAIALSFGPARAEGIRLEALQIPADIPGSNGRDGQQLEALVVRPDDGQPRPLAMLNRGSPRSAEDRPKVSPYGLGAPRWRLRGAAGSRWPSCVGAMAVRRDGPPAVARSTKRSRMRSAFARRHPPANAPSSTLTTSRPTKAFRF